MKKVFDPIIVNKTEIKNRFAVSAMVVSYIESDGMANERFISYHENKARGGWGLIITEDYEIDQHVGGFHQLPGLWKDEQIESHRELTERVHKHGAVILAQLYHAGRETTSEIFGRIPVAPSPVKDPTMAEIPRELTTREIHEIIIKFADAAERAQKAGFDGIEVHGAHGYLVNSFLSGFSNKRTDEYGGSIQGRARFATDIINAVRERTGEDFIISLRISTQEYVPGGLTLEESKVISQLAETAGADLIHCSQGVYATTEAVIAPSSTPRANFIDNAAAIRAAVNIPVIAVGRINDPLIADNLLCEGKADITAMSRASLADPYLPLKTLNGDFDDINRCIGCNQGCIGRNNTEEPVRCLVNPLLGMEYKYEFSKAGTSKKILVAGGGVAGCEAAIVSARRGHKVTLYEASDRLGGQWITASVPIGKSEFTQFIVWQKKQLEKYGVEIKLDTELSEETVKNEKPDVVIVATGSTPYIIPFTGIETGNVVTAADVLRGNVASGDRAIVVGGGSAGCETADHIAFHGCSKVYIIDIADNIAADMQIAPRKHLLRRMKKLGIEVYTGTSITEINGTELQLTSKTSGDFSICDIDTIIMATGMKANDGLAERIDSLGICEVISVGDSRSVKDGYHNIQEAFDIAYEI